MDAITRFGKHIKHGRLTVHLLPEGRTETFGSGLPHAEWILHNPAGFKRIFLDAELMLGESYMDAEWDVPHGTLPTLLEVLMLNFPEHSAMKPGLLFNLLQKAMRRGNSIVRSYHNVAHHYDLDEWLFRHFLGQDMQYSCAYFSQPGIGLDEAQRAKCHHIMGKLALTPGQHVLDIGSGWGGLALYLAEQAGVKVTGLTLSREQLRVAQQRAKERGLQDRVEFRLQDYREHGDSYDRIVSVGMFEHVGASHYARYFERVSHMLHPDGTALLHTIGRFGPPGVTNPWIKKYIFPGGYNPALSEISRAIEKSRLITCDVEVLRLHYAMTLEAWHKRFSLQRAQIVERMGERFCRMWEFYLAVCAGAFRWRDLVVFQLQLAHRVDAVPITRAYLYPPSEPALILPRSVASPPS